MSFIWAFLFSFAIALALTPLLRRFAISRGIVDRPGNHKVHEKPVAYLGGLAIFVSFAAVAIAVLPMGRQLGALLLGAAVVAIVGAIDDIRPLSPWTRLGWQFFAAGIVLAGGIGITSITNPLGGSFDLSWGRFAVDIFGLHFNITPIANAFSVLWIVGMINAINFLDGLDGLATGVSAIAALVMFLLAISPAVNQPIVALLALILAGSALGFLPYNFFPARIFLGDSGAYFLGLTLALIAIYSGGKLATTALVLGFAIIDALWAAVRRIRRRSHPFQADREHLHHLLVKAGLSQRLAVLLLYALAVAFGLVALISSSFWKLVALIVLFAVVLVLIASLIRLGRRRATN